MVLSAWGVVFTAWLNYLEAFVIHAWCEWCIGSAAMVLLLFVLAVMDWRETGAGGEPALEYSPLTASRLPSADAAGESERGY